MMIDTEGDDDDDNIDDVNDSNRTFDPSLVPLIVGISKDLTVCKGNNCGGNDTSAATGMTSNNSEEWYIHLAFPQPDHAKQADGISPRYNRRVQVPLVLF
eukprot:812054_1